MQERVGIEWELQIVDHNTFDLSNDACSLMQDLKADDGIDMEVHQSCVEIKTSPALNTGEAQEQLSAKLKFLIQEYKKIGLRLCSLGTHPFSTKPGKISPNQRFYDFEREYPYITHYHVTFGTHVHVSMDTPEQSIMVMNRLRVLLPVFIALSSSCPYWKGETTGFVSFRQYLLRAAQNSGIPPHFNSWQDYQTFFNTFKKAGFISTIKDIHWDIRPRADFGTLELRIMDAVPTIEETIALASMARCLMVALKKTNLPSNHPIIMSEKVPLWAERENHFQASHLGVDANFISSFDGDIRPLRSFIEELLNSLEQEAKSLGEFNQLMNVKKILNHPPYERIAQKFERDPSMRSLVKYAADELM
jgi:glutamate---cysteine ligase / carboxylate-amine ligase